MIPMTVEQIDRFLPCHNSVLVKCERRAEKTENGLYLPEKSQQRLNRGVVVATGPGAVTSNATRAPMAAEVGDEVMFTAHVIELFHVGEDLFALMPDESIMGVLA